MTCLFSNSSFEKKHELWLFKIPFCTPKNISSIIFSGTSCTSLSKLKQVFFWNKSLFATCDSPYRSRLTNVVVSVNTQWSPSIPTVNRLFWHRLQATIDWCCFYYLIRNCAVALLEALFTRTSVTNVVVCLDTEVVIRWQFEWSLSALKQMYWSLEIIHTMGWSLLTSKQVSFDKRNSRRNFSTKTGLFWRMY